MTTATSEPLAEPPHCATCGTELAGRFCHHCGEKSLQTEDFSVRGYLTDVVQQVTNLDFKLLRSFRTLLFRPGQLTREFALGRRRPYTPPLTLFLMANVLYFFLAPHTNTFNANLANQLHQQFYSQWATNSLVEKHRASPNFAMPIYDAKYNLVSRDISKSLVIINAPFLALLFFAVNRRRSRYLLVDVAFSLHFFAFLMILLTGLGLFFQFKGQFSDWLNHYFELVVALFTFGYFALAVRQCYRTSWQEALLKAAYLQLAYLITIILYRLLLFLVTLQVA
ncbi:MAG: DUF3667 domain-containing protein [Bernardetiaceae bacterium]|jgi:hypothetical protein|nr:DUF3667 domain-containing protein [Bernardetiaceae bacterium]